MKISVRIPNSLLLINILALLLAITSAFLPQTYLRILLGLPFTLFSPGYVLSMVLFPQKDRITFEERAALSFGLSIMSTVIVGLAMNYSPWGFGTFSILFAMSIITLAGSIAAFFRWRRLPAADRISISPRVRVPTWTGYNKLEKVLTASAIFIVIVIISVLFYGFAVVIPGNGERFTEFYIVTTEGPTDNYPGEFNAGQTATAILGLTSHEERQTTYHIDVILEGVKSGEGVSMTLSPGEKGQKEVSFILQQVAQDQKVEFLLYKNGGSAPYATLYLFIDAN